MTRNKTTKSKSIKPKNNTFINKKTNQILQRRNAKDKKPLFSFLKIKKNKTKKILRAKKESPSRPSLFTSLRSLFVFGQDRSPDKVLLMLFIFFLVAGLLMILDASLVFAKREFHNPYHFVIYQAMWVGVGLAIFSFFYFVDYKIIKKYIVIFYILTIILLIATLFTNSINGARSWLSLGAFSIQPSELSKLTFLLYISANLVSWKKWNTTKEFFTEDFIPFILLLGGVLLFVLLGRDLGTSIIIASIALFIYFYKSNTRIEYMAFFGMLLLFVIGGIGMIALEGYRGDRVSVWWNALTTGTISEQTEQGSGYQQKQIFLALGSGGLLGVGFTESLQKYDLVETTAATDSVIAIIAEEFGYLGAIFTLGLYLVLIYRGLKIASSASDKFGQMVAVGIVAWIGMQTFVHVASNVVVTPLTGVPMPFLSYGGSSLISCMAAIGILLNISRKPIKQ